MSVNATSLNSVLITLTESSVIDRTLAKRTNYASISILVYILTEV